MTASDEAGYFLDADTLERLFRAQFSVVKRLSQVPEEQVWVSSNTAEEMLCGASSEINRAREQGLRRNIEASSRNFTPF